MIRSNETLIAFATCICTCHRTHGPIDLLDILSEKGDHIAWVVLFLIEFGNDGGIIGLLGCGSSQAWLNCFVFGMRSGALVS